MNRQSWNRHGAFAAAVTALSVLTVCDAAPAAVTVQNACAVKSGYLKKTLKEGAPVAVSGFIRISPGGPEVLATISNEDKSCEVVIEGTDAQMQQAAKCGDGAKATVRGRITEEVFVPAVVPLLITCD